MKALHYSLFIVFLLFSASHSFLFAQNPNTAQSFIFTVKGKIVEKETNLAMEYCSVSLHNQKDSSLVNGVISDAKGFFELETNKPGIFYLKINYIGFETKTIRDIKLNPNENNFNAGIVLLTSESEQINAVEVTGIRTTVRYEMDKKVVTVDKNMASESGTAVDVLETVPSVTVDVNGNVKLRGKSNFLVLVNGQPTQLEATEALQQIPANQIKNIEIITNPSAKYEAENTAGILNIILKTNALEGTSGLLSLNGGTFGNFGGSVNLKHNVGKFTFDFGANMRQGNNPNNTIDSLYTSYDEILYTTTETNSTRSHGGFNFTYGIGYQISKKHSLKLDFMYGRWQMKTPGESTSTLVNETLNNERIFKNVNNTKRGAPYYGPSLTYLAKFNKDVQLTAFITYTNRNFKEAIINDYFDDFVLYAGEKSTEEGMVNRLQSKIDIVIPIKKGKLEFGGQASNHWNSDNNVYSNLDITTGNYYLADFNNSVVENVQSIYGIYASYGNTFKKLNYTAGLRGEYTDREIHIVATNQDFKYYQWHYFPSAGLSYNISDNHQVYLSYATRINRPQGWNLEPFAVKTGPNTYFSGNPDLKPTLVNSVELGWSKIFKKNVRFSLEAFYKYNANEMEFVREGADNNSITTTPYNVGFSQNVGLEANFAAKPFKFWNLEVMPTGYYTNIKGQFAETVFDKAFFEYTVRINNYFTITKTTKIQLLSQFRSGRQNAQGNESNFLNFDIGIKQSFLKNALNLTLNARNVFNTNRTFSETISTNYYYYQKSDPRWPMINLAVSYKINNYKPEKSNAESASGDF